MHDGRMGSFTKKHLCAIMAIVMLFLCFTLSACGNKYASQYSAMAIVMTDTSNKASVSFGTFNGTYVMKLKNTSGEKAIITYHATLEEGNIKVYYDFHNEKLNLFGIATGGSVEATTGAFTGNHTIYIMIESDGECSEGSFSFALEKADQ